MKGKINDARGQAVQLPWEREAFYADRIKTGTAGSRVMLDSFNGTTMMAAVTFDLTMAESFANEILAAVAAVRKSKEH